MHIKVKSPLISEVIVNTKNKAGNITTPNLKLYYRPIVTNVAQYYAEIGIIQIEKSTEPINKLESL